jgi:hypothetical protein
MRDHGQPQPFHQLIVFIFEFDFVNDAVDLQFENFFVVVRAQYLCIIRQVVLNNVEVAVCGRDEIQFTVDFVKGVFFIDGGAEGFAVDHISCLLVLDYVWSGFVMKIKELWFWLNLF